MNKTNGKKKSPNRNGLKSSTFNLFLNISLFLLSAVIIYMGYSIYIKLSGSGKSMEDITVSKTVSEIIQVEVLNGCGVAGVADRFTDFLRSKNVDVVKSGNYISADVGESLVIDRSGNLANAYQTAKLLGIKSENVIQQLNKDYFLDVSIVVGRDYFKLTPLQ
ncbi:MAG: hypothetical protein CVV24_04905 [Ignavibacteriae bacterium HGW-Ignavibacteriae-3]|nr:MAG: hypothetical protein CVV24_04905 [Ignavibacteriae bacterium HGW-Ignavibacteriae-3]